jgi:hypothetical protein
MRLPSDLGGACAPTADRSLKLNLVGTAETIIRRTFDAKDDASLKAGRKTQPGSGLQHIAFEPHFVSMDALPDHSKSQALIQMKRWIRLEDVQAQRGACLSRFVNQRLYKLSA